jgi:hypothetical protein
MESMKKLFLFLLLSGSSFAQEQVAGIFYFKEMFGHVHEGASAATPSLTTIQCNHPLKVLELSKVKIAPDWAYVETADVKGYVKKEFLNSKKANCFQGKYPRYFDGVNLDLTELYYWGKLYDQYERGYSRVN